MNEESLGKKFKNGNQEYECIAYTDKPTITMKNLETEEKINMVVGSYLAREFEEIIENKIEKAENEINFYDYASYDALKNKIDKILYILRAINLAETKINNLNNKINEIINKVNSMEE